MLVASKPLSLPSPVGDCVAGSRGEIARGAILPAVSLAFTSHYDVSQTHPQDGGSGQGGAAPAPDPGWTSEHPGKTGAYVRATRYRLTVGAMQPLLLTRAPPRHHLPTVTLVRGQTKNWCNTN